MTFGFLFKALHITLVFRVVTLGMAYAAYADDEFILFLTFGRPIIAFKYDFCGDQKH